jgi:hypothetical protein
MVGLLFRGLGLLWLAWAALRAAETGESLRWMATGLFIYYMLLHGWAQSWYLLPLLPLLPFADPRLLPAMRLYCFTAVAYYALVIPYACAFDHTSKALSDLAEALVTEVPPLVVMWRARVLFACLAPAPSARIFAGRRD